MKKNLFLLFSIYFFVLQPLIIGILRGQANFFWLGAINLVAIILIGLLYNTIDDTAETEVPHEKKHVQESKVAFHGQFRATVKDRKKKQELVMPTLISLIVAVIIFFMFQYTSGSAALVRVLAIALGFVIFISLTFIFKHRISKSFWRLVGTKLYIILLALSIAWTAYDYYQVHNEYQISFQEYIGHHMLGYEILPPDGYVLEGEGTILGTGLGETGMIESVSSDVFDLDIEEATGTVLGTSIDTLDEPDPVEPITIGNQTLIDAVLYLLKKYDVPLVTKKDISFTYVSFSNENYAARRTAYANKMIGKTTNPSKHIVCETYIVMKGLLEKWPVTYTSTNVLEKFRAEAVKRDVLNGCIKGRIVTDKNL